MAAAYRNLIVGTSLLFATPAYAQSGRAAFPCPQATIGWALQWSNPPPSITSASYDSGAGVLYIVWNGTNAQAFSNVPVGVMQALSFTTNPVQIYNSTIVPSYHQILLSEKDNCPLQWEFGGQPYGYIWTD